MGNTATGQVDTTPTSPFFYLLPRQSAPIFTYHTTPMSLRNPERGLFSVKGLIFSLGLIASFIFVGVLYSGLIRPAADKAALAQSYGGEGASSSSGILVMLKD